MKDTDNEGLTPDPMTLELWAGMYLAFIADMQLCYTGSQFK
jgi:hypothetical protein